MKIGKVLANQIKEIIHYKLIREDLLYSKLCRYVFHNCRVILDVGCGRGVFIKACMKHKKFVIGVDIDPKILTQVEINIKGSLIQADANYLPFKDSSIDCAFFSHVIEHLEDPFPTLKEIYRVLSRKGIFVVITPTMHKHFYIPGHVHAYTKEELQKV